MTVPGKRITASNENPKQVVAAWVFAILLCGITFPGFYAFFYLARQVGGSLVFGLFSLFGIWTLWRAFRMTVDYGKLAITTFTLRGEDARAGGKIAALVELAVAPIAPSQPAILEATLECLCVTYSRDGKGRLSLTEQSAWILPKTFPLTRTARGVRAEIEFCIPSGAMPSDFPLDVDPVWAGFPIHPDIKMDRAYHRWVIRVTAEMPDLSLTRVFRVQVQPCVGIGAWTAPPAQPPKTSITIPGTPPQTETNAPAALPKTPITIPGTPPLATVKEAWPWLMLFALLLVAAYVVWHFDMASLPAAVAAARWMELLWRHADIVAALALMFWLAKHLRPLIAHRLNQGASTLVLRRADTAEPALHLEIGNLPPVFMRRRQPVALVAMLAHATLLEGPDVAISEVVDVQLNPLSHGGLAVLPIPAAVLKACESPGKAPSYLVSVFARDRMHREHLVFAVPDFVWPAIRVAKSESAPS